MFQKPSPDIALGQSETFRERPDDDVETVVGPSVHVEGDFASEGNILVKGTVSGNVKTSKRLTVEDGAKIFANVQAGSAIISGEIRGDVSVEETAELRATARVVGDVNCKVLAVEAGCLIYGKVTMPGLPTGEDKKRLLPRQKVKLAAPSLDEELSEA